MSEASGFKKGNKFGRRKGSSTKVCMTKQDVASFLGVSKDTVEYQMSKHNLVWTGNGLDTFLLLVALYKPVLLELYLDTSTKLKETPK